MAIIPNSLLCAKLATLSEYPAKMYPLSIKLYKCMVIECSKTFICALHLQYTLGIAAVIVYVGVIKFVNSNK